MPDPRHHQRERRIRRAGNGVMAVATVVAAAVALGLLIIAPSPVTALVGPLLAVGIILLASWKAPSPYAARHADALAMDAAELPDAREAGLPYGAALDGRERIVLVWVRWKRRLWFCLLGVLVLLFLASALADGDGDDTGRVEALIVLGGLVLGTARKLARYRGPGLVMDPEGLQQPSTGARLAWRDVDRVSLLQARGLNWVVVRGARGTVYRPLWGTLRRRIHIPVGALSIDEVELIPLLRVLVEGVQGRVESGTRGDVMFEAPAGRGLALPSWRCAQSALANLGQGRYG